MGNSVGISPMLICLLISVTKAVFPNTENAKEFKMQHATKDDEASPRGHLEPLGSHGPPTGKLDIVDNVPSPPEFYQRYVRPSKPVVLKGAARSLPAFQLWTDEYLRKANGALEVEVEEGKKEDRSLNVYVMTLKQFLDNYLDEDLYLVESLKPQLHGDFGLLRCLLCGGFTRLLQDTIMWLNSGGTKSVLHYDDVDNINCVLDGDKKVLLVDKNDAHHIDMDRAEGGYSNVDVDMVDMYKYPGLQDLPYYLVNLSRGDCLYLPARWPHHVRSGHSRSLAVNVWFARLQWFDEEDCHKRELPDFEPLHNYRFSSTNEPLRSFDFWMQMVTAWYPGERCMQSMQTHS
ncbi:PREDICTED: jmjC domain-containing protein 7-like isoform X2 [Priapulus caudatus]|uniref:JmjC domain-containing protein 7-like isoform X2 n=1 Tax=Priapulus caudatus TaxID=37621 RepID=A0ABM1DPR5_PRICU|nr:PREDICTED: jmjC domain-containing protein 7-like isoform X2 [Priapulus caudatus]